MVGKLVSGEGTILPEPTSKPSGDSLNDKNAASAAPDAPKHKGRKRRKKYSWNHDFTNYDPWPFAGTDLTPLALNQLRLDFEAAQDGGRTSGPEDFEYFDPFDMSESILQYEMRSLGLDFEELKKRAEARFPRAAEIEGDVQRAVTLNEKINPVGMKGLLQRLPLWLDAKRKFSCSDFEHYADAVGMPANSPARVLIEAIAPRYAMLRYVVPTFPYWAQFAVMTLFDEEKFAQFIGVAFDMSGVSTYDLVHLLCDESLDARIKRKAARGLDDPSVVFVKRPPSTT
jgi:hypothetical protein